MGDYLILLGGLENCRSSLVRVGQNFVADLGVGDSTVLLPQM